MEDRNFGRRFVGGLAILFGLALVVWVFIGTPGGIVPDDSVFSDILLLFFALILVVSGGVALRTRVEDFEKRQMLVTCASCEAQRRSDPGDVCPECGSTRLILPRLNRVALGSVALAFGVPPIGMLGVLVVQGPQRLGMLLKPPIIFGVSLSLLLATSSVYVLWQGRLPRIPWFVPWGGSIRGELENILYSRAYALAIIFACFAAVTVAAVIVLAMD